MACWLQRRRGGAEGVGVVVVPLQQVRIRQRIQPVLRIQGGVQVRVVGVVVGGGQVVRVEGWGGAGGGVGGRVAMLWGERGGAGGREGGAAQSAGAVCGCEGGRVREGGGGGGGERWGKGSEDDGQCFCLRLYIFFLIGARVAIRPLKVISKYRYSHQQAIRPHKLIYKYSHQLVQPHKGTSCSHELMA